MGAASCSHKHLDNDKCPVYPYGEAPSRSLRILARRIAIFASEGPAAHPRHPEARPEDLWRAFHGVNHTLPCPAVSLRTRNSPPDPVGDALVAGQRPSLAAPVIVHVRSILGDPFLYFWRWIQPPLTRFRCAAGMGRGRQGPSLLGILLCFIAAALLLRPTSAGYIYSRLTSVPGVPKCGILPVQYVSRAGRCA